MPFFSLFFGAFSSSATYRKVRASGQFLIGYTLLLVAFSTLIITVYFSLFIHREIFTAHGATPPLFDSVAQQIADQMPVMTMKKNVLATKDATPSVIKISGTVFGENFENLEILTIDTSGQSTAENMKTPMLVNATEFVMKTDQETKIRSLSDFTKGEPDTILINHAVAEDTAHKAIQTVHEHMLGIAAIIGGSFWLCFLIFAFILRICMLLTLAVLGQLIGAILDTKLTYASAFGLAALSYTPIAVLDTVLTLSMVYTPHTVTLLVAGVVTLFAAIACTRHAPAAPTPPTPSPFA